LDGYVALKDAVDRVKEVIEEEAIEEIVEAREPAVVGGVASSAYCVQFRVRQFTHRDHDFLLGVDCKVAAITATDLSAILP